MSIPPLHRIIIFSPILLTFFIDDISKQKSNGDALFNIVNLIAGGRPNFATNAAPSAPSLIHRCLLLLVLVLLLLLLVVLLVVVVVSLYCSKRYIVTCGNDSNICNADGSRRFNLKKFI